MSAIGALCRIMKCPGEWVKLGEVDIDMFCDRQQSQARNAKHSRSAVENRGRRELVNEFWSYQDHRADVVN